MKNVEQTSFLFLSWKRGGGSEERESAGAEGVEEVGRGPCVAVSSFVNNANPTHKILSVTPSSLSPSSIFSPPPSPPLPPLFSLSFST